MKWQELLSAVGGEPVFETGLLLVGPVDRRDVARQLSRWVRAGRLIQLRRGLYAFAESESPGLRRPHPYVIANRLVRGSYVSLSSVLAEHGIIPEYVPTTTSVTTGRPGTWATPLGTYTYRHVKSELFWGYEALDLTSGDRVFVATPEKALVDLLYLERDAADPAYLAELRLQNLDRLRLDEAVMMAKLTGSRRVREALEWVTAYAAEEAAEYHAVDRRGQYEERRP
ncbi:MAG: type IV toxin-antitoxin system AbiEi family antitoxin domain-containing protein [Coriobacteriia bacterium]|nr:type IV toxin-antitoxin system AbiEi family antitoxin domain-containing protein [Coriobacteriia bacterium]